MSLESISQSRIGWRVSCLGSSENLLGFIFFGQLQFGFDPGFTFVCMLMVLFPLYTLLWNIVGKEIITINRYNITIKRAIFGIGLSQTYQLSQVHNLRRSLTTPRLFTMEHNLQQWGFAGGSIAFDYKRNTYRFGLLLSEKDADVLVMRISQYMAAFRDIN